MLEGFPGSLQGSRGKVLLGQRVNNNLERGSAKMCLRAVLGTRSSTGLKVVVGLGEDVGSPSPSYSPAAEGKGLLDCFLCAWWMFGKDTAPPALEGF